MYLDDWAIFAGSRQERIRYTRYALKVFAMLGLRVNTEKSVLTPRQNLHFLGIDIDTIAMRFTLPKQPDYKAKRGRWQPTRKWEPETSLNFSGE
ncbi:unnamed protein product [Cylicostephanus goldi]|uniref:Reverse transcriptase domain-containing protein n=1 Tax=Cylicostephanus goldi TaxID=71465 RepID=A0A3P7QV63_CYLGO|nr:unnamed protein product [Cylicostephanus goldi]